MHDTNALQRNPSCVDLSEMMQPTPGHATHQKTVVGVSVKAGRASPKSQIFNLQSLLAKMFFGFRSR